MIFIKHMFLYLPMILYRNSANAKVKYILIILNKKGIFNIYNMYWLEIINENGFLKYSV